MCIIIIIIIIIVIIIRAYYYVSSSSLYIYVGVFFMIYCKLVNLINKVLSLSSLIHFNVFVDKMYCLSESAK